MPMTRDEFTETFLPLRDGMFRFALRMTGRRDEAEDIVQEVYERFWRRRDTDFRNPAAAAMQAVHNLSCDRLRRRRREQDAPHHDEPCRQWDPVERQDLYRMAERLIARLPDTQRATIHLRDVEGLDTEQTALALNMTREAVRMNLSRARCRVKEEMIKLMNHGI